jgi:hypothetical protein
MAPIQRKWKVIIASSFVLYAVIALLAGDWDAYNWHWAFKLFYVFSVINYLTKER